MIAFAGELSKSLGDTARSLQGLHKESCWCRESTPDTAALKSRQRVIFLFFFFLPCSNSSCWANAGFFRSIC